MERQPHHQRLLPGNIGCTLALLCAYVAGLLCETLFFDTDAQRASTLWGTLLEALFSPFGILLLLFSVCVWVQGRGKDRAERLATPRLSKCPSWLLSLVTAATSLGVSLGVAHTTVESPQPVRFGDLPPAYHDEYSYLFQAKTFLAGRLSYPSHPTAARLFDQMHLLNEGRFAGRYFPSTAAWIAPFLAIGHPIWGHWLAGALTATFVFWTGRELAGDGVGFLAGMLTALAPGMALFSNLLLAHHPTLLGLSLFLFAFTRLQRTYGWFDAVLAGTGLCFAMLSRPMTAFGVGLPFGLWTAWWLIRGSVPPADRWQFRAGRVAALGAPVLLAFVFLFFYNRAITGSGWTTPYQVYTDIYTPRHVYGFDNVVRGEQRLGPKVVEAYDSWAENLTPQLAVENARNRLLASWYWTLGVVPLAVTLLMSAVYFRELDMRWRLIAAAIVSLHVAHVPYWYDGIMHYHYVFESGPLWLLLFAKVSQLLFQQWREWSRPLLPVWWCGVIGLSIAMSYIPCQALWPAPKVRGAVETAAFSRLKYAHFRRLIDEHVTERPALVLVEFEDAHVDYVVNDPDLQGDILFGRFLPEEYPLMEIVSLFPERTIYVARFDSRANRWAFGVVHKT